MEIRERTHRIEIRDADAHLTARLDGELLVDTHRAKLLTEGTLPVRYYVPQDDVRMDLLEATDTTTECPFKGDASYWTAKLPSGEHPDVFWAYVDPLPQVAEIAGYLSFYDDRFEVEIDGEPVTS